MRENEDSLFDALMESLFFGLAPLKVLAEDDILEFKKSCRLIEIEKHIAKMYKKYCL